MIVDLLGAWQRFWFRPTAPQALARCRIAFYAMLLLLYGGEDLSFVPDLAELSWRPISSFSMLAAPSGELTFVLSWIWRASLVAAMLGIGTRVAAVIAALLGLYLVGLPYCVSRMSHEMAAPALTLIVMAFARSGDALSFDARGKSAAVENSPEYHWPIQLVRVLISLVFFSAGLSKLRHSGLDWIFSDNLQLLLGQRELPLGLWLAEWPTVCRALAGATVVIELLHPLALFWRRAAMLWAPAGVLMLLGSWLTIGVPFWPLIWLHVFWLPRVISVRKSCDDRQGCTLTA